MSFNLKEEIIDGHLVTAETKKLWAVEMDLAQKLLEVCKKHNLKIWATGGTLLGAVRHKGFIPWDDDMDFSMMRDDYNKLLKIGPTEFKEPYFFQSIYTDNISGGLIKIRNSNTTMLEKGYDRYKTDNLGCAIDVFVMDEVSKDPITFAKKYRKIVFLRRVINNYVLLKPSFLSLKTRVVNFGIGLFFKVCNVNKMQNRIVKILSSMASDDNDYVALIDYSALMGYDVKKIKMRPKDCYSETVMLPFHDMTIPAPSKYNILLTSIFGDYMKPVKGIQAHSIIKVDCERSYKEVLAELRSKK